VPFVDENSNKNQGAKVNSLFRIYIGKNGGNAFLNVGDISHYGGITIYDGKGTASRYGNLVTTTLSAPR